MWKLSQIYETMKDKLPQCRTLKKSVKLLGKLLPRRAPINFTKLPLSLSSQFHHTTVTLKVNSLELGYLDTPIGDATKYQQTHFTEMEVKIRTH